MTAADPLRHHAVVEVPAHVLALSQTIREAMGEQETGVALAALVTVVVSWINTQPVEMAHRILVMSVSEFVATVFASIDSPVLTLDEKES